MSIAWAPIALILLLLPGIFFFIGLASYERLSREIIRSSVVSEVAMAVVIAGTIHFVAVCALSATGFRLSRFLLPLVQTEQKSVDDFVLLVSHDIVPAVIYLAITTTIGFGFGLLVAEGVISGPLRFLAHHKWIYDIVDADRKRGIITAYVMTNIVDSESRIIMYGGRLHDIFLSAEGSISYLILKNCSRYYMTFKDGELVTSKQLNLFSKQGTRPANVWDRLLIEGTNIANVLFDSSPEIKGQAEGAEALDRAFQQAMERLRQAARSSTPPNVSLPGSS